MVMNENEKRLKIKSAVATVIAIILLALYFIRDFIMNPQIVVAGGYVVIILICVSLTMKKNYFCESIYILLIMFLLSILVRYSIPHLKSLGWFRLTFLNNFTRIKIGTELIKRVFTTSYMYFYLIGLVAGLISTKTSNLPTKLVYIMKTLGRYSFWAIILHICTTFFENYNQLEGTIFCVFFIGAFLAAFSIGTFGENGVLKSILLVLIIELIEVFYAAEFINLILLFQKLYDMEWYYSLGLALISLICILSDEMKEDYMIGISILGTNLLILLEKSKNISFGVMMLLLFHIVAISAYQFIWNTFYEDKEAEKKLDHRLVYVFCYIGSFLLTMFIKMQFMKPTVLLIMGGLALLVYYGNYIDLKGKFYGILLLGVVPWILLEVIMSLLGKLQTSLFSVMAITVMFWCVCGVGLAWKDSSNIKSIIVEKVDKRCIIFILSTVAYLLSAVLFFI